jgi:hypothetical protein
MKRFSKLSVIAVLLVSFLIVTNTTIAEPQEPYRLLRSEASEDAADVNLCDYSDFANKPGTARIIGGETGDSPAAVIGLVFTAGSASGKTFKAKVYAWKENGPAEPVFNGKFTTGTQKVVKYPHDKSVATSKYWAGKIEDTNDYWISPVCFVSDDAGLSIGKVYFKSWGYKYFYVVISDADGSTGSEAGNVAAYYTYSNKK